MPDVLCLGEILVDWVCTKPGAELDKAEHFTKAPGGAPANVAVGLARQGVKVGFIGRVSTDGFGIWLRQLLEDEGVDTSGTISDPESATRMAYVTTTSSGDRRLAEFSRVACADARLRPEDLKPHLFADASLFHFGSISLIASPAANATEQAVNLAQKNKLLVSYDPNVRIGLWPSAGACRDTILATLKWADIVKINADELEFLTGDREFKAADKLREEHGMPLLIVTLDAQGAYFTSASGGRTVPGFKIKLVEATGAGDGFASGIIHGLIKQLKNAPNRREGLKGLTQEQLASITYRANALGALTCTRAGAIPALPTVEELERFLAEMKAEALA
jgi:sugar/nucleoside kinase (ribokinase family)